MLRTLCRRVPAHCAETHLLRRRQAVLPGCRRGVASTLTVSKASSKKGGGETTSGSGARAVRYVPLSVVTVSKGGGASIDGAVGEYAKRCTRYAPFEEVNVKQNPKNVKDNDAQREHEGERVMKTIGARDFVILMDERGKDVSSEDMADLVARIGDEGYERGVFVLGGPFGHGPQVVERANASVRLSKMVLNHQVARLVLVEAIYRAHTILRGEPYHH